MHFSRRNFLRTVGGGVVAGAALRFPSPDVATAALATLESAAPSSGPVRLDSNENAYGPCKKAIDAMSAAWASANRYPFREYDGLVERIARYHTVKPAQVLVGAGSTEVLRAAALAFTGPGKQVIQALPTFEAIGEYAKSVGTKVISLRLDKRWGHDLPAVLAAAQAAPSLVYICNPNNPTGSLTLRQEIEDFIRKMPANCYVLIDEAYHHFAEQSGDYESFIDRPVDNDRVIVARTFSKVYGLAGLRIGYGIASPKLIERMRPFLTQDGLNNIAIPAAIASLDDNESLRLAIARNRDDRQEFFNHCQGRRLKPIDSHANFYMMNIFHPAPQAIEIFRQNNVLIGRHFPPLDTYIRVSLGTPHEMQAFWDAWEKLPYANEMRHH